MARARGEPLLASDRRFRELSSAVPIAEFPWNLAMPWFEGARPGFFTPSMGPGRDDSGGLIDLFLNRNFRG